ncbi:MAG: signal recognition particle-docking protein FtsY [Candidatus Nezhaarchaeota archaeon]|nr:signal recognition particle-docking protein FtsY [Candidatus Nezhaarchaeota archaeon]MCX8142123.1 signal recognition particle-docking protein FtsY [Candidatus Nezhaarchaeota archaeon]MDW8050096.1 signal recognition particle-docking protein FtsY [Nitrososphaerota archaeon]
MFEQLKRKLKSLIQDIATKELNEKNLSEAAEKLRLTLIENDVALPVAFKIVDDLVSSIKGLRIARTEDTYRVVLKNLRETLYSMLASKPQINLIEEAKKRKEEGKPFIIMFVGPNGHGKTLTVAKVANLILKNGFSVVFACSDTFRAGAEEQLDVHAARLGVKAIKHGYGSDPAAVAYDAVMHAKSRGINCVLIDTAGRLQTDKGLMDELRKIARVVKPDLKILVVDALTGNDAYDMALKFNEAIGIDATILTKVDADVKGGAAISIFAAINKPILYLGTGQQYDDLQPFDARWFIDKILPLD